MEDRLTKAEVRIAFLEQAGAQLSDELNRQRIEIESLRENLAALVERLEAARSAPTDYSPEDEKPPHY
jgi:uncharacterized coiled-coil protein SlyX